MRRGGAGAGGRNANRPGGSPQGAAGPARGAPALLLPAGPPWTAPPAGTGEGLPPTLAGGTRGPGGRLSSFAPRSAPSLACKALRALVSRPQPAGWGAWPADPFSTLHMTRVTTNVVAANATTRLVSPSLGVRSQSPAKLRLTGASAGDGPAPECLGSLDDRPRGCRTAAPPALAGCPPRLMLGSQRPLWGAGRGALSTDPLIIWQLTSFRPATGMSLRT